MVLGSLIINSCILYNVVLGQFVKPFRSKPIVCLIVVKLVGIDTELKLSDFRKVPMPASAKCNKMLSGIYVSVRWTRPGSNVLGSEAYTH